MMQSGMKYMENLKYSPEFQVNISAVAWDLKKSNLPKKTKK
jgi:hypothetical protein